LAATDLTSGSIPRHILALAMPVAMAMLLQSAYALIDLAFVSRLGDEAVAGLSISLQAFFVVLALSQAIAAAALAEISQDFGAGRIAEARASFSTFSLMGTLLGVASWAAAWTSADLYVALFTEDPVVAELGAEYFRISAISFLFQLLLIVFGNALRASGDFTTPMKIMASSVVTNLVVDPLLIFGLGPFPELGLAGAAWATVGSQVVAVSAYVLLFTRARGPRELVWTRPHAWGRLAGRVITRGLPAGLQFFLISVVVGAILAAMKPHGPEWTATAGGGFRVMQQTFLPLVAIASAAAAISGQNLGAGLPDRVRKAALTGLAWAAIYGVAVAVLLALGGRIAGHVFAKTDASLDLAAVYFWWSSLSVLGFACTYVPTFVLQAAGHAVYPMLGAMVRVAVLYVLVFVVIPAAGVPPEWVFGAQTATALLEGGIGVGLLLVFLRRLRGETAQSAI
jgi:putative MATE family efflux protein